MTDDELIARQARQIEQLRDEVADLKQRILTARSYIYCIGGPLNDSAIAYTREQLKTFVAIAQVLGDVDIDEG